MNELVPVMTTPLRERLLADLGNRELRQKYLATRTAEWAQADLRLASQRLMLARIIRGVISLGLVGAAGGALGDVLFPSAAQAGRAVPLPVLIGMGCAATAGLSFAALAALGLVVLPEMVGEWKERRAGPGIKARIAWVGESVLEAGCGCIWGVICGLLMGLLGWVADAVFGLPRSDVVPSMLAGAAGGVMLAAVFGLLLAAGVGTPGGNAAPQAWSALGPLPAHVYLLSYQMARRRFGCFSAGPRRGGRLPC